MPKPIQQVVAGFRRRNNVEQLFVKRKRTGQTGSHGQAPWSPGDDREERTGKFLSR